jgi:hypothetical protein
MPTEQSGVAGRPSSRLGRAVSGAPSAEQFVADGASVVICLREQACVDIRGVPQSLHLDDRFP